VSPNRRLLVQAAALVVVIVAVVAVLARVLNDRSITVQAATNQSVAGPVVLVPGYGGSTSSLLVLAEALRAAGRTATVLTVPGDGTGDLALSVAALDAAVGETGLPVDVIGYSAGGVVARLWAGEKSARVRRVVTLGSPHHGTQVAAIGAVLAPGACPDACQQLVPGSALLDGLNDGDETPPGPQWLSLWTVQDETVTPPDSARLDGAINVELQQVCPGLQVTHSDLPRDAVVTRVVLGALAGPSVEQPTAAVCG